MTMERDFFPLKPLVRDRAFLLSLCGSLVAVIALGFAIAGTIASFKIEVTPIAEVSFVPQPPPARLDAVRPLSEISQVAVTNNSNKPAVVAGWVINLGDFCKSYRNEASDWKTSLVLVQANGQLTAATSKIGPKTCDLIKKLSGDETIYATSDTPFLKVNSEKRFIAVDFPK
jgi:hypothetical protein